ncbi:MAG: hypothetical protein ACLQLG_10710 [Thermoguttaceae bacterium]
MSLSEEQKILLSQLVDGELPLDQANQVLAAVLGDALGATAGLPSSAEAAGHLRAMLQLRETLGPWRRQEPPKTIVALTPPHARKTAHVALRALSLAAAALLGGILVAGGFVLRGQLGGGQPAVIAASQPAAIVTPEQRREIAQAFALHESVAGPLCWYAADDATIQVAPAQKGEALRQPIAIVLRFVRELSCSSRQPVGPKTYVIVCRNGDAAIELPPSAVAKTMRVRLLPTVANGTVSLQYAIAADGSNHGADETALAGSRRLDLGQTPLGQLALNDCLVNVEASAWVIGNHTP